MTRAARPGPLLLLAPGAGASVNSPWMQAWAERLAGLGPVEPFDYPYMQAGKKLPDKLPKLIEAHREALAAARARHPRRRVVLVGKSMGSRVGCHLSLEEPVDGLVCLGYPLVGLNGAVRDEVLRALTTRVLFLQGTRDPLCPLERLEAVRAEMQAPSALHVVEGGDHSLEVRRKDLRRLGTTQAEVDHAVLEAVRAFLAAGMGRAAPRAPGTGTGTGTGTQT